MSWKMFWQIVSLIVIATVVASVVKCATMRYKFGHLKCFKGQREMPKSK
ncbi:MAG: hypothetical protein NG712_01025 [Omnitrophica bacterium]|nr:hypothetical protein [Candidatus Omnitrophota bacterium]